MNTDTHCYSALIAADSNTAADDLRALLPADIITYITCVTDIGEARQALFKNHHDFIICETEPTDDVIKSAKSMAADPLCGILLIVNGHDYERVIASVESAGVMVLEKSAGERLIRQALHLMIAARAHVSFIKEKNDDLRAKMDEIKLVNRAKWLLIDYLKMSEPQAHRYIEKQAMDMRVARVEVALNIIKTYEN